MQLECEHSLEEVELKIEVERSGTQLPTCERLSVPGWFVKCHSLQATFNKWNTYAKLNSLFCALEAQNQWQSYIKSACVRMCKNLNCVDSSDFQFHFS